MKFPAPRALSCLFGLLFFLHPAQAEQANHCTADLALPATIKTITADGLFELEDGRHLRLSGIDYSSKTGAATNPAILEQLTSNAQIKVIEAAAKDRWGRVAAHIFVKPDEATEEAWLQGFLMEEGLARRDLDARTDPCAAALKTLEAVARKEKRGLWAEKLAVIPSTTPAEILKKRGELAYVEGQVIGIGETRSVYYLNFGKSWQKDFTIVVLKRHLKLFDAAGLSPRSLDLKHVFVRGIVDGDAGPRIEVQHPDQIEIRD